MEASSCVKAVVVSGNQYRNNPSDMHLVQLQRQLDVSGQYQGPSLLTWINFNPSLNT